MKRKLVATFLVLTTMCTLLTGCQGNAASGDVDTQNQNTQNVENDVTENENTQNTEDEAVKVEYPVDMTTILSDEETNTLSAFLRGLTAVALVDGNVNTGDKLEEVSDTDKVLAYYFTMSGSDFRGLDSFETKGMLEEADVTPINGASSTVNGYKVSAEQYAMGVGNIFKDGLTNDDAVKTFLESLNNDADGVPVYEDGAYGLYNCLEYSGGELKAMTVTQTSETTVVIEAQVELQIALEGGLYDIHVEAELDETSAFAGMRVTGVSITCTEAME